MKLDSTVPGASRSPDRIFHPAQQRLSAVLALLLGLGQPAALLAGLVLWLAAPLPARADSAVVTLTRLHSFGDPLNDAAQPYSRVIEGSDGALYGTTYAGGAGYGTVFRVNKDGTGFAVLKSFNLAADGGYLQSGVTEGSDGALYGTAIQGGTYGAGTVYRLNKDGTGFAVLKNFNYSSDGASLYAGVTEGSDGALYGTTVGGGTYGYGTVFRLNKDGTGFTVLKNFYPSSDGGSLYAGVIEGSDGALYGTARQGGTFGNGTVYRLNKDGSGFAVLRTFNPSSDGANPYGGVTEGSDGVLYGTAYGGGTYNFGTVYRLNKDGSGFAVFKSFNPSSEGANPYGGMTEGSDGALYGTARQGGIYGAGTAYRLNKDGSGFAVLRNFNPSSDGWLLNAGVTEGSDGALYGTAIQGGTSGNGTVYRLNKDGTGFAVLKSFKSGNDGSIPYAGLTEGSDGALYGTAYRGGTYGNGTVYRLNKDGSGFAVLKSFSSSADGAYLYCGLTEGRDGALYGTAYQGGTYGNGTVYRLNKDGTGFAVLKSFNYSADGAYLYGGVTEGSGGALYGTAISGGISGYGTVFKLNKDGTGFAVLKNFDYSTDGGVPFGGVTEGSDGALYGTAYRGGTYGYGTVYRLNKDGTGFTVLKSFNGGTDGGYLYAGLTEGSDGALYGTASQGGAFGAGTMYRLNKDGTGFAVLKSFNNSEDGRYLPGRVTEGTDGVLYGTAYQGGTYNAGTVYRLSKDGSGFEVLLALDSTPGGPSYLWSAPRIGSDGRLYVTSLQGGDANVGTVFALELVPPNQAPSLLNPGNQTVDELAPLAFTLAATDPNAGDTLTYSIASGAQSGMNLNASSGAFSWTPSEAQGPGIYGVTFRATDGGGLTSDQGIMITVNEVNTAPTAVPAAVTTAEDTPAAITLSGTDLDLPANPLTSAIVGNPAHGVLTLQSGVLTYTPATNYNGSDSVTFKVNDGTVDSAPATVSITITPVNDPPVDRDRTIYVYEDNGGGQLQPVVDVDGDPVTYVVVTPPEHGRVELQGAADARHLTYIPDPDYNGPDSFTFKATDGVLDSPVYTYTIVVIPVNDPPVANSQAVTTAEDTAVSVTLTASDVDGDTLTYSVTSGPSHGSITGTVPNLTYTPWPDFNGSDNFTFKVNDGTVDSAAATVSITVTSVNDAPVVLGANLTTKEDTVLPVLLSAADVEASGYQVLQVFGSPAAIGQSPSGGIIEGPDHLLYGTTEFGGEAGFGTVFRVNQDGSGFTVLHSFAGNGSEGAWPRARLAAGPGGVIYGTTTTRGNANGGTIWKINLDGTGFAVLHHKTDFPGSSTGLLVGSDGALYGTTVFGGAASSGAVFKLGSDGSGYAVLHSFSGLVNEGGRPYAQLVEDADGELYGTTEVGGADPANGGTLFKIQKDGTGFAILHAFAGGTSDGGTLRRGLLLASDGALYGVTPSGGLTGKGTVFKLQRDGTGFQLLHEFAADGKQGGVPQATLVEDANGVLYGTTTSFGAFGGGTVFRINQDGTAFGALHHFRPGTADGNQAQGELVAGSDGSLYGVTVRGTATDAGELFKLTRAPSGLTYAVVGGPVHGTLSGTSPNLTYTPAANYNGADTFTFKVNDGTVDSAPATVSITVTPVNDPPTAVADSATMDEDSGANTIDVLSNDSIAPDEGETLTVTAVTQGAHGSVQIAGGGTAVSYQPAADYFGPDAFTYTISDGNGGQATATVTVTVNDVLMGLTAISPSSATADGTGFTLIVNGSNFEPDTVVYWNGNARPTHFVSATRVTADIPATDLANVTDIQTVTVRVGEPTGPESATGVFTIVPASVGEVQASVVSAGDTATVSSTPAASTDPGVAVAFQNNGGDPVTVVAATYDTKPTGETVFKVDGGSFVDVQFTGADSADSATVYFYYRASVTGGAENKEKLRYFDGTNWVPVLSSGGVAPVKNTTNNLDETVSGGRFTVVFDDTSKPKITDLSGTIFGMIDPTPQIVSLSGPTEPLALGSSATVGVSFALPDPAQSSQVSLAWDDGTTTVVAGNNGSASADHQYGAAGVYGVTVTVSDAEGAQSSATFQYVVVYDPNGGFVTGGGWINSPAEAFVADPTLTGRATFGFVSKYQKGATVPTGNTEFQFKAGGLNFSSTAYQWLVVSGAKAQYKGSGTINGMGDFGFLLTATDGQVIGGGGVDQFRIKIWDTATSAVVYDNVPGASDDLDAANPQVLGGGSIVIQKAK